MDCKNKSDISNNSCIGTTSKSFRKYQSNILGKYEIKELQKREILAPGCPVSIE
jgi:hypothetical protein